MCIHSDYGQNTSLARQSIDKIKNIKEYYETGKRNEKLMETKSFTEQASKQEK